MASDIVAYALLAVIFVVTGIRMFMEKPNRLTEIPLKPWKEVLHRTRRP
jgi:cytochrome b subunit of formate dehydrogenase